MKIKTKTVSEWHSLFLKKGRRRKFQLNLRKKIRTRLPSKGVAKFCSKKIRTRLPKKGVAKIFVPFVRRLQHANKVEYVNMFVILSDTGRGILKQ